MNLGNQELIFRKRTWDIGGETLRLRYGDNSDQPSPLYELVDGGVDVSGVLFRGPSKILVSALTKAQMTQTGKHPDKINLPDMDNSLNILQYLSAKPAAVILKHNNICGAAWTNDDSAAALELAFVSDSIAAFGWAIVLNYSLDKVTAELIDSAYLKVVAAPNYENGAVDILKRRKNLCTLRTPGIVDLAKLSREPLLDLKLLPRRCGSAHRPAQQLHTRLQGDPGREPVHLPGGHGLHRTALFPALAPANR